MTWPESVDEALCVGWIDGVRRTVDERSYAIRFTPRRPGSTWSLINVRKMAELTRQRRVRAAGRRAFERRKPDKTGVYSFERRRKARLPAGYRARLKAHLPAWTFYQSQPPWYRRTTTWWIVSATKEETRMKRLDTLIADSAAGRRIGPLARRAPGRSVTGRGT